MNKVDLKSFLDLDEITLEEAIKLKKCYTCKKFQIIKASDNCRIRSQICRNKRLYQQNKNLFL